MKFLNKTGLAAFAAIAFAAVAFAQTSGGFWSNWPIVGSASYSCGSVNSVSNCTVPAGPTVITGTETIPANTGLAGGQNPQNVLITPAALGVGPYQYTAPLTGVSVTVASTSRKLIIEPAGTIAALTVVLPAATALVDNQAFGLCSTQIVTALTITPGSGTTVSNTVTALTVPVTTGAASCPEWVYRKSNTNWYRIH